MCEIEITHSNSYAIMSYCSCKPPRAQLPAPSPLDGFQPILYRTWFHQGDDGLCSLRCQAHPFGVLYSGHQHDPFPPRPATSVPGHKAPPPRRGTRGSRETLVSGNARRGSCRRPGPNPGPVSWTVDRGKGPSIPVPVSSSVKWDNESTYLVGYMRVFGE